MKKITLGHLTKTPKSKRVSVSGRKQTADQLGIPNNRIAYIKSLQNDETVEYVQCKLPDAHVFKLPDSEPEEGWRALDMKEELWQGTIKVLNRDSFAGLILLDRLTGETFAVCPLADLERCSDSSRYFVVRVKLAVDGKFGYFCLAFNERGAAFDFNMAVENCKRERDNQAKMELKNLGSQETDPWMDDISPAPSTLSRKVTLDQPKLVTRSWRLPGLHKPSKGILLKPHQNDKKKPKRGRRAKIAPMASSSTAETQKESKKHVTIAAEEIAFADFECHPADDPASIQQNRCGFGLCFDAPSTSFSEQAATWNEQCYSPNGAS